ncbi:MAG: polysaccharide deacetylase family protein [bacterium]|nr:polysaccharide deacetylase family protein [bacterium]
MKPFELSWRIFLGGEVLALAFRNLAWYPWVAGLLAGWFALVFVRGLFDPRAKFFIDIFNGGGSEPVLYLTFDDGPDPDETPALLEWLAQEGIRAGFFVTGERAEAYPQLLAQIAEAGHQIGNHSFSHAKSVAFSSAKAWRLELERTDRAIEAATGKKPRLFRPPVGITTPSLASAIEDSGRVVVGWSLRSLDWFTPDPNRVAQRILDRLEPGALFLLHDVPHPGASALEVLAQVVPQARERGYRFALLPF